MDDADKRMQFLAEYSELCRKYQMYISACGCCDSPWVCAESDSISPDSTIQGSIDRNIAHLAGESTE